MADRSAERRVHEATLGFPEQRRGGALGAAERIGDAGQRPLSGHLVVATFPRNRERLERTGAVVDEALRLYPPAYAIYREPVTETTLGGYAVPADATVMLPAYQIHRDERWWDASGEFRPERWLGSSDDRPEYAYVPFGGGPRHCIGMRFARMELQLALATILQRIRFERVTETLEPDAKVTLDPGTVLVRTETRE